jgi:hypothetical protein
MEDTVRVRRNPIRNHRFPQQRIWPYYLCLIACLISFTIQCSIAQDWKPLTNAAPASIQIMVQMTDGTILAQSYDDGQSWMKLTPDASGSYVNGTWTMLAPELLPRFYFASQVLPDGRYWLVGGEYTGPGLLPNWGNRGEIYDPVTNKWTAIASFPAQPSCPYLYYVAGNQTAGSTRIRHIYPQTKGIQKGWAVFGQGIPDGATVVSVDDDSIRISAAATQTLTGNTIIFNNYFELTACFGDDPSMLLPGGKILTGFLAGNSTWLYDVRSNSWSATGSKVYNDPSDEEGWAKLPNGNVLTYDLFKSIDPLGDGSNQANGMYAEEYNPNTASWSGISPSDGSARGSIPQLSSVEVGYELGPMLRLQDGRVLVIGATQHTGIYNPSTNTWAAGPDIMGTLSNSANPRGRSAPFGADDAPAAELPNGHVIFAADAGPSPVAASGNITSGSPVITGIPSTALLQVYWSVSGNGIPGNAQIASIDSKHQVTLNASATATVTADAITFGGVFSNPTQLFDFNPSTNTIAPLSTPIPDGNLPYQPAYPTRMLTLPTGQVMFSDGGAQAWIYTASGSAKPELRPAIGSVTYEGKGVFKLSGTQLNGQSAGAAYGDDDQMDSNYPLVRFTATDGSGKVYYGKTTNWSSFAVGGGPSATETVNFTLNAAMTKAGKYSMEVIGAGIASAPRLFNITQAEISKHSEQD